MSEEPIPFEGVPGVRLAAVAAGIRYQNRKDLCLMELAPEANALRSLLAMPSVPRL